METFIIIIKIFIILFSTIFITCQNFVDIRDYKDVVLSLISLLLCVVCFILSLNFIWIAAFITEIITVGYKLREYLQGDDKLN